MEFSFNIALLSASHKIFLLGRLATATYRFSNKAVLKSLSIVLLVPQTRSNKTQYKYRYCLPILPKSIIV